MDYQSLFASRVESKGIFPANLRYRTSGRRCFGEELCCKLYIYHISISISSSIKSLITMVYCICQAANDRHYKQNIKKTTQTVTILYV